MNESLINVQNKCLLSNIFLSSRDVDLSLLNISESWRRKPDTTFKNLKRKDQVFKSSWVSALNSSIDIVDVVIFNLIASIIGTNLTHGNRLFARAADSCIQIC